VFPKDEHGGLSESEMCMVSFRVSSEHMLQACVWLVSRGGSLLSAVVESMGGFTFGLLALFFPQHLVLAKRSGALTSLM
jgi:hypothetical protein